MPGRSSSSPPVGARCREQPARACRRACPGAGCTTTPAALSTTSRCSSSYASVSSGSGDGRLLGAGAGGSIAISSPPASLWLFGARLARRRALRPPRGAAPPPPASRPPAVRRDSGRAALRRPRPGRRAAFRAWTAAARFSLGEDERGEEDPDADHDEAVGEVERRPVAEVEEVGDEAEPHAVGEVREAAADHEAERDGQHGMAGAGAREVGEHPGDRDRR